MRIDSVEITRTRSQYDSKLTAFNLDEDLRDKVRQTLRDIGLSPSNDFSATLRALLSYFVADREFAESCVPLIKQEIRFTPKGRRSKV